MTEERTERQHYNKLVRDVQEWQGLEGLSKQLANWQEPEGQSAARAMIKPRYAAKAGKDVSHIDVMRASDSDLRDDIVSDVNISRRTAVKYLGDHLGEIIEGIPNNKLEEKVYDVLPGMGFMPNPKDSEHDKRHLEYLSAKTVVDRVAKGELTRDDESNLRALAAQEARKEAHKYGKNQRWDEKKDAMTYLLFEQAEGQRVALTADTGRLIEYGRKAVEERKEAFKRSFDKEYTLSDYARDLIGNYAEEDLERTALAIAQIGS